MKLISFLLVISSLLTAEDKNILKEKTYCVKENLIYIHEKGSILIRHEDDNCFYSEKVAKYVQRELLEQNIEILKGF